MKQCKNPLKETGTAIGVGLIAGFAGTLVMSRCQKMEMKKSGRNPSVTPLKAVTEVLDIKAVTENKNEEVSKKIHWAYGTSLGMIRGLLSLLGLKGVLASSIHFGLVWGGSLVMLPTLKVAPPVTKEKPKTILKDAGFHLIYAFAVGCVFDAIMKKKRKAIY